MSEPINLVYLPGVKIEPHGDRWKASFKNQPVKWGVGKGITEAVGDLFITHGLPLVEKVPDTYTPLLRELLCVTLCAFRESHDGTFNEVGDRDEEEGTLIDKLHADEVNSVLDKIEQHERYEDPTITYGDYPDEIGQTHHIKVGKEIGEV